MILVSVISMLVSGSAKFLSSKSDKASGPSSAKTLAKYLFSISAFSWLSFVELPSCNSNWPMFDLVLILERA